MRVLYSGRADDAHRAPARARRSVRGASARGADGKPVPLHRLPGDGGRGARGREAHAGGRVSERIGSTEWFGAAAKRKEDPPLLRREGRFVDDIALPGMLHAAFVRSPYAHAKIGRIDKTAALALPGVHAVITFSDLPETV